MRASAKPARVERRADRADAPVHHVGRRHHVGAGVGEDQRLAGQRLDGGVVGDAAGGVQHPVLAVVGVRVEGDVGDHAELGDGLLDRAHGARHQAVGVAGLVAAGGLARRVDDREQRHRGQPQFGGALGLPAQFVRPQAVDAGHGFDRLAARGRAREQRPDQVVGRQAGLAQQAAREVVAAHAAHARGREAGGKRRHGRFSAARTAIRVPFQCP